MKYTKRIEGTEDLGVYHCPDGSVFLRDGEGEIFVEAYEIGPVISALYHLLPEDEKDVEEK